MDGSSANRTGAHALISTTTFQILFTFAGLGVLDIVIQAVRVILQEAGAGGYLLMSLGVCGLSGALARPISARLQSRTLAGPIRSLSRAIDAVVNQSDTQKLDRIPPDSPGEFGELAESVNRLIDRLAADSQAHLERYRLKVCSDEASETTRAMSAFYAEMSHEIRTPMTAIQGYADLLMDPNLTQGERIGYVNTIRRNSDHLLTVINDILNMSKIEAGKLALEVVECSPSRLITDVAALMQVRVVEKGLTFEVKFLGAIPSVIRTDPTRLRQILMNLIGNAIKFTQSGSVIVRVRCLEPGSAAPRLSIDVVDTGVGIAREKLPKLFQPFAQADESTSRLFGGTGLGLAISKRLAVLLGGDISIESQEGRGSRFTLSIATGPLMGVKLVEQPEKRGIASALPDLFHPAFVRLDMSILLAEDSPDNQVLFMTYLKKVGARVTLAANGRVAVEMALAAESAGRPFDVILMDMHMPELDGYGATTQLRSSGYRGPIVALTASAASGDREKCLKVGCDVYLTKPVDRDKLLDVVQSYLPQDESLSGLPSSIPAMDGLFGVSRADAAVAERVWGVESAVSATMPVGEVLSEDPAREQDPPAPALASMGPSVTAGEPPLYSTLADEADMLEIIDMFVGDLPRRVRDIEAALNGGDMKRLRELAHQLRGAAGGFGFMPVTAAAAEVEDGLIHGRERAKIDHDVAALTRLCGRTRGTGVLPLAQAS